jgi:hypothetical protein
MANKAGVIIDASLFTSKIIAGNFVYPVRELFNPYSWPAIIPFTVNTTAGTTLADDNIGLFFCNG